MLGGKEKEKQGFHTGHVYWFDIPRRVILSDALTARKLGMVGFQMPKKNKVPNPVLFLATRLRHSR
jgi:hypothetical protein